MSTHNLCFEQEYEKSKKKSNENCHFYSQLLFIAWACFRNVKHDNRVTTNKPSLGQNMPSRFVTRSYTNRTVRLHNMARGLKFRL